MKSHRVCCFVVVLCALSALLAGAQQAMPVRPSPKTADAEVRRLSAEEVNALLHNDLKALDRLWATDFHVTNPLNKFVTGEQVRAMMSSGFLVITSYDRRIEYSRVYGDTAILAGRETVMWGGRMTNAGKSEELRFTAIWMRIGGRWQEVIRHANILPRGGGWGALGENRGRGNWSGRQDSNL